MGATSRRPFGVAHLRTVGQCEGVHPHTPPPDKAIWILQHGPDQVTKWSTTGTLLATVAVAPYSFRMIYDGAGNIWVASNLQWGGIRKINEATGTYIKTINLGQPFCRHVCSDGINLWIRPEIGRYRMKISDETWSGGNDFGRGQDGENCYDFNGNVWANSIVRQGQPGTWIVKHDQEWNVLAYSAIGPQGGQFAGNPQPPYLYAADGNDGSLRKVTVADASNVRWDLKGTYGCRYDYYRHPFTFDGTYVWGLCSTHSKLHKIDVTTGTYAASYNSLSLRGDGLCFDGVHLWHHGHNGSAYVLRKTLPADGSTVAEYPTGLTAEYTYHIIVNRAGPSFKYWL